MLKSALALLLATSTFFLGGCYEVVSLSRDDYRSVNKYDRVDVVTDTAGTLTKYRFGKGMCVVQNDTLIGTGTRMSDAGDQHGVTVEIPTSQISLLEVSRLNLAKTLIIAAAAVGLTVGMVFLSGAPGASGSPGQPSTPVAQ